MWLVMLRLLEGAGAVGVVTPPPAVGLPDTSISNFYVIDYRTKRRRPLNDYEWSLVKQWAKIYRRTRVKYFRDMTQYGELERKAERELRNEKNTRAVIAHYARRAETAERQVKQLRRRTRKFDPSGLMPKQKRQR